MRKLTRIMIAVLLFRVVTNLPAKFVVAIVTQLTVHIHHCYIAWDSRLLQYGPE